MEDPFDARLSTHLLFHLADTAETGLFDKLSHPDLMKNENNAPWDLDLILPDIRRALDRIAATGYAMELNTSSILKRIPERNPGPEILAADAHIPKRAGDRYIEALEILAAVGFKSVSGFRERQRFGVPIPAALASLNPV